MCVKRLNKPRAQNPAAMDNEVGRCTFQSAASDNFPLAGRAGCERNEFAARLGRRAKGCVGWKMTPKPAKGANPRPGRGLCRILRVDLQDISAAGNYSPARPKTRHVGRMPGQLGRR